MTLNSRQSLNKDNIIEMTLDPQTDSDISDEEEPPLVPCQRVNKQDNQQNGWTEIFNNTTQLKGQTVTRLYCIMPQTTDWCNKQKYSKSKVESENRHWGGNYTSCSALQTTPITTSSLGHTPVLGSFGQKRLKTWEYLPNRNSTFCHHTN